MARGDFSGALAAGRVLSGVWGRRGLRFYVVLHCRRLDGWRDLAAGEVLPQGASGAVEAAGVGVWVWHLGLLCDVGADLPGVVVDVGQKHRGKRVCLRWPIWRDDVAMQAPGSGRLFNGPDGAGRRVAS